MKSKTYKKILFPINDYRKLLLGIFITFHTLLFTFHVQAAERVDPLKAFLSGLETLKADFTQTLVNEDGNELEKSTGVLYLQQPGEFHWSYQKPYMQQIISNGELLWIYDEDLEQVTIRKIGDAIDQTPAGIILGNSHLEKYFVQVDLGKIEGFDWIELTPRDLDAQYKNIRFGFEKNRLGMMIIADNLGQTTRIDFSKVEKNEKLQPDLFKFKIPENVDVIDERDVKENLDI